MEVIENKEFGGERPLFASYDLLLRGVTVHAGESALKCCRNIEAVDCRFEGKYPFWHLMIVAAVGLVIALFFRNNHEKGFTPSLRNGLLSILLLAWSIFSLSGVSTFLYFNF